MTTSLRRRLGVAGLAVSLLVAPLISGGAASASTPTPLFVGWSALLPAWSYTYTPSSRNECTSGAATCIDRTLATMRRHTTTLASRCDHNAVFALAYLRTTERYKRVAKQPGYLQDARFVNHEDAVFAAFYFRAYQDWVSGNRSAVPPAWRIALDAARDRKVTGTGDLLLGMSAHVNRDLPFVLAGIGLTAEDGTSRKPDHDKINQMLNTVVSPLLLEEARRFDPMIDDANTPYGLSYTVLMQALILWRETAWRNAERLIEAPNATARAAVAADIEAYSATVARGIALTQRYLPPLVTTQTRDAYCAVHTSD